MNDDTFFDPDVENTAIQPAQYYVDQDGTLRFITQYISSVNFDGTIEILTDERLVSEVNPGMLFSPEGFLESNYFPVVALDFEDPDFSGQEPTEYTIVYLNDANQIKTMSFSSSTSVYVRYEDWDSKDLGSFGWTITSGGNAIFSNVAVRGRVEATEGEILGNLSLGGSLTASTNNGQVIISSSGIFGSTSSGSIEINNITGNVEISGNITVDSGIAKELTVGEEFFPIINVVGESSSPNRFIMTVPYSIPGGGIKSNINRTLSVGDYFKLQGTSPNGHLVWLWDMSDIQQFSYNNQVAQVISASFESTSRYLCEITVGPGSFITEYNLGLVPSTASSGSFTIGRVLIGADSYFSMSAPEGGVRLDGIIFDTPFPYSFFDDYIPDYIDSSGRFKLGKGKLTFDGENLTIDANLAVGDLSASYALLSNLASAGQTLINGANISTGNINANLIQSGSITSAVISGNTIKGGTISGQTISGGTISGTFINGGFGSFSGAVTATSGNFGTAGQGWSINSYYLSGPSNGISLAAFGFDNVGPGIIWGTPSQLEAGIFYNYNLNEILFQGSTNNAGKKNIGIVAGFAGTQGTVRISGSQINLSSPTSVNGTLSATSISATSITGQNGIETRQVVISTSAPSSPGSYRAGTLWAVI